MGLRSGVIVDLRNYSDYLVDVMITDIDMDLKSRFTDFYEVPKGHRMSKLWDLMRRFGQNYVGP